MYETRCQENIKPSTCIFGKNQVNLRLGRVKSSRRQVLGQTDGITDCERLPMSPLALQMSPTHHSPLSPQVWKDRGRKGGDGEQM